MPPKRPRLQGCRNAEQATGCKYGGPIWNHVRRSVRNGGPFGTTLSSYEGGFGAAVSLAGGNLSHASYENAAVGDKSPVMRAFADDGSVSSGDASSTRSGYDDDEVLVTMLCVRAQRNGSNISMLPAA